MNNSNRRFQFFSFVVGLFLLVAFQIAAAQQPQSKPIEFELALWASEPWSDAGADLKPGDVLEIHAEPKVAPAASRKTSAPVICDAEGGKPEDGESRDLPVPTGLPGALIVRLGTFPQSAALVGRDATFKIEKSGHLFLGVNTDGEDFCEGIFRVRVRLTPGQNLTASADNSKISAEFRELIDRLPRRVHDFAANEGDMVNFIIVGPSMKVQKILAQNGWVLVDRNMMQAVVHAAFSTYNGVDYVQMPMSELYLFGRVQEVGYAQAEAYTVVATRHHFRLWKAPWIYQGQEVWVGAGTHDIGFEKDQRNGLVTHKIDPNIDLERDYIGEAFTSKGDLMYLTPSNPFREGYNATGGKMQSDGRILMIALH